MATTRDGDATFLKSYVIDNDQRNSPLKSMKLERDGTRKAEESSPFGFARFFLEEAYLTVKTVERADWPAAVCR